MHKDYKGEWEFDLDKKPIISFAGYFTWLKAIKKGQDYLKKKSEIEIPTILLYSSRSGKPGRKWNEKYLHSDIILNTKHIEKIGRKLGNKVTSVEIENGMHDLLLSPEPVRNIAFKKIIEWLKNIGH